MIIITKLEKQCLLARLTERSYLRGVESRLGKVTHLFG